MERLFLECTVRAALLVAGPALVLYAMRVKAAATRHSVWAAVLLVMLALPVWAAWGPKVSLYVLPTLAQRTPNDAMTLAGALSTTVPMWSVVSTWQAVFLGIYMLGLCLLLLRLAIGTIQARTLVRAAVLQDGMRVSSVCSAPVTVGLFRATVILPEHWRHWPQAQLHAVLTHEREHARRRDSLIQWLALLNRALFWFHPAAWWLERHLSTLAEEACDNVVLACGHNPRQSSEYLLEIARSVKRSGARLNVAGMAMPGSFLPQRIRKIIEGAPVPRISRTRMACVAVICTVTCTVCAAGKLERTQQATPEQSSSTAPNSGGLRMLTPTQGVDFSPYLNHLLDSIKRNWYAHMPQEAYAFKGQIVIRFTIQKNGKLSANYGRIKFRE